MIFVRFGLDSNSVTNSEIRYILTFRLSAHKLFIYIFVAAKYMGIQLWKIIDWFEEEIFGYIYRDNSENNFLLFSSFVNFRQHDVKFFLIHFLHLLDIFFDSNKRYVC